LLEKNIEVATNGNTKITIAHIQNVCRCIFNYNENNADEVDKIYYYDSLPINVRYEVNPINETKYKISRSKYFNFKVNLFNDLENAPDERNSDCIFKLKLGYIEASTWEVKEDFVKAGHIIRSSSVRPKFTQKCVDVELALDLVLLAQKEEIKRLFIMTNDSDFSPVIKYALELGTRIILVTLNDILVSSRLKEIVDDIICLDTKRDVILTCEF